MLCPQCMSHGKTKGSPYLIQEDNSDTKGGEKSHTIEGFITVWVLDPS